MKIPFSSVGYPVSNPLQACISHIPHKKKGYLRYKPATKAGRSRLTWQTQVALSEGLTAPERKGSGLACVGGRSHFSSKVYFFFLNTFTHFQANETNQLATGGLDQITHFLVRVLNERLLNQAVLSQEFLDAATHHFLNDLGRLAFHVRLGTDDLFLFFQLIGRHFFRRAYARVNRGNVHGDVTGQLAVTGGQSDNRGNLVVAVNVATHNLSFYLHHTTYRDVLTDFLNQRFALAFQIASHQGRNIGFTFLERGVQHFVGEIQEVIIASNKVSLGVYFQNVRYGVVVRHFHQRNAFSGGTAGFLGSLQTGRLTQLLDRSFNTAASFYQSLLALHHAKAGTLTQFLDHCSGNCSHVQSSCLIRIQGRGMPG